MRVLLFGGTSEGRALAGWLSGKCPVTLCVATEYGADLAPKLPGLEVRAGRLDEAGIAALLAAGAFRCAVDATHPYAVQVSQNLRAACERLGVPYLRLVRAGGDAGALQAPDAQAAGDLLETMPGNILLTTGSKNLDAFARPGLISRCFPRVLPSLTALGRCLDLGFPPAHIICAQGPFSREMNEAMLRQWDIRTLVTKDSGAAGGAAEKAAAAESCGCTLLAIARPGREEGFSMEEMRERLEGML